jgi:hypothetical protein
MPPFLQNSAISALFSASKRFLKSIMYRRKSMNLGGIICLIAAVYILYDLLLCDNPILPFSIHRVAQGIAHWTHSWHILVIGLLPIYIALMIYGTAIAGINLGSALQRWLASFIEHK